MAGGRGVALTLSSTPRTYRSGGRATLTGSDLRLRGYTSALLPRLRSSSMRCRLCHSLPGRKYCSKRSRCAALPLDTFTFLITDHFHRSSGYRHRGDCIISYGISFWSTVLRSTGFCCRDIPHIPFWFTAYLPAAHTCCGFYTPRLYAAAGAFSTHLRYAT